MIKLWCPQCHGLFDRDPTALKNNPILKRCVHCGVPLRAPKHERQVSDSQRRSRDQEKRSAKKYKMERQLASGSMTHWKSDGVATGKRRGENKETTSRSFQLKLDELLKLERESRGGETPIFIIEFQGVHPFKSYEVLPAGTLENLIAENEELRAQLATNGGSIARPHNF